MKEYQLKNYVDDNGKEPILEWLKTLDGTMRKRILLRLERLKDGNFGDYKRLNDILYELRFNIGSGYRIYYTIKNDIIILLINGGDKKTQSKDINNAMEILTYLKEGKHEKHK